ncbi:MAG: hypothetical protein RJQ10_07435 [Haliea sp.]|uniref:hypothetical protein n=1 Tax=Haliea sp. TaxID=1932666 RepID=UPI0032EB0F9E
MNVLETEWWSMALAPEWWADVAEDGTVLVGDEDDVGCLEITTLHKEQGAFDSRELLRIAEAESSAPQRWQKATCGDFSGWQAAFTEEGAAVREWYLAAGSLLLFVSYSCDLDNRGMDDAAVDALLDTLVAVDAGPT